MVQCWTGDKSLSEPVIIQFTEACMSRDRLIFNIGIPIPGNDGLYIEMGPMLQWVNVFPGGLECSRKTMPVQCIALKADYCWFTTTVVLDPWYFQSVVLATWEVMSSSIRHRSKGLGLNLSTTWRHFLPQNTVFFQNFHLSKENQCCCPCTVSNSNFANKNILSEGMHPMKTV